MKIIKRQNKNYGGKAQTLHASRSTLYGLLRTLHASRFTLHDTRGQFLIEAIVAGSVLIVGFSGILALLARSLHLNRVVTENYIGTYLAAEGIEIVKNMIDHNAILIVGCVDVYPDGLCPSYIAPQSIPWNQGINGTDRRVDYESDGLLPPGSPSDRILRFDSTTGLYGYSSGNPTSYERAITIRNNPSGSNPDEIEVVSTVTWSTSGLDSQIVLVDRFFDWRP